MTHRMEQPLEEAFVQAVLRDELCGRCSQPKSEHKTAAKLVLRCPTSNTGGIKQNYSNRYTFKAGQVERGQ